MDTVQRDNFFMQKALALAEKARGFTSPNPMVGAVIVKNGTVIADGYHHGSGLAHAEIEAMRKVPVEALRGATLYVNLEPCCHYGKTPPCVDEIIRCRFKRVVIAVKDPNPLVAGRSIKKMQRAGIKVTLGVAQTEARRLNEVFFKNMCKGLPFVATKVAQSLDGKIATAFGESQWITSEASRRKAKHLRDSYDCVLVGVNTVIQDDPGLKGLKKIPFKVIIDPRLQLPPRCRLLQENPEKVIVFTSSEMSASTKCKAFASSVDVCYMPAKKAHIAVNEILHKLFEKGITSVFVEGGSDTLGRFFDAKCVDKVYFFIAPKIIGGKKSLSAIGGKGVKKLKEAFVLKDITIHRYAKDFLIEAYAA